MDRSRSMDSNGCAPVRREVLRSPCYHSPPHGAPYRGVGSPSLTGDATIRIPPILTASLLAAVFAGAPAFAADDAVTLNFVNADIEAVVKAVAEMTGRNFVIDPRVKGTINIVSAKPVPKNLVYPTLLSALRLQGFTAIEGEGSVKIVPEADAKQQGSAVAVGPVAGGGDRLVTQVTILKYESAQQMVSVLR